MYGMMLQAKRFWGNVSLSVRNVSSDAMLLEIPHA
jgi:hypothetical protein